MSTDQPKPFDRELLLERNLAWNDRPMTVFPIPFRLSARQRALLETSVPAMVRGAEAVADAFVRDAGLRESFGYGPLQEKCILADPGYLPQIPLGRLDSYLYEDSVQFLEYNTDGTAGWYYQSALDRLWKERLGKPAPRVPLEGRLFQTLMACFRQWDRKGVTSPRIAVVDWNEVPSRHELQALASSFSALGSPATVEDPRGLNIKNGRLVGTEGPVDLVYRRVVSEELFQQPEQVRPFLEACCEGLVCCVGGFRTDPVWSKYFMVLLSDPRFEQHFSAGDRRIYREVVPWSRRVAPEETPYKGQATFIPDLLKANRERFILKPERSYQGEGIVAGPYSDDANWRSSVDRALDEGGYIAQEFLSPVVWKHSIQGERYYLQVGEFVLNGAWAGIMPRVCPEPIVNRHTVDSFIPFEDS
ncbi:MAG: hypothetical protein P8Z49_00810 [Acidobacteriota bacterium]